MPQRQRDRSPDLTQQPPNRQAEHRDRQGGKKRMGNAAMGIAILDPTADRIANLTDRAGGGVEVGELGAENGKAERQGVGSTKEQGSADCGDRGVGKRHHVRISNTP